MSNNAVCKEILLLCYLLLLKKRDKVVVHISLLIVPFKFPFLPTQIAITLQLSELEM